MAETDPTKERTVIEEIESKLALLRQLNTPKAKDAAARIEWNLERIKAAAQVPESSRQTPAELCPFVLDITKPLVVEDDTWREKVKQVNALPRWAHEPEAEARSWFDGQRSVGPAVALDGAILESVQSHLSGDFIAFLWHCCIYKDRNSRKRMLAKLTPGQLMVAWRIQALLDAGVPIRLVYLKVRQMGSSWLFAQFDYWLMSQHENVTGIVIAHEDKASRAIFGYLKDAYEQMPAPLRPAHEHSTRAELILREKKSERLKGNLGLDSQVAVHTAANDLAGSGTSAQFVHGSEVGKWHIVANTEVVVTSVAGTMQEEPLTMKVWESTAHGSGTYFHLEWDAAMKMGQPGWNGFTAIFVPWYVDPRNATKTPPLDDLGSSESDEFGNEVALKKRFDLDDEQLAWRRDKIRGMPDGGRPKVDLFKQEFPSTPREAWLHAFGKAFAPDFVEILQERVRAEKLQALFEGDLTHCRSSGPLLSFLKPNRESNEWLRRRRQGPFRIWRLPNPRHDYIVGADVAFGLTGGDASCAKVFQRIGSDEEGRKPMRLAAEWYGLADDDTFAHILWRLGHFYSVGYGKDRIPAMLAWEKIGPGTNIAKWLRRGERPDSNDAYPAGRMYRVRRVNSPKERADSAYGITTSGQTKPVMIGEFVKAAREDELQLIMEDVNEVEDLEREENDRIDTHGYDRFMACCMAVYAAQTTHILWGNEQEEERPPAPHSVRWAMQIHEKAQKRLLADDEERSIDFD